MDLVDYSRASVSTRSRREYRAFADADRPRGRHRASRSRRCTATTSSRRSAEHALVSRADADGLPGDGRRSTRSAAARAVPHAGAVGQPAAISISAASPARIASGTIRAGRARCACCPPAARAAVARIVTCGRRPRAGRRRPVGDADARRRDRRQPRRHARQRASAPAEVADQFEATHRLDGRRADAARPPVPAEDRHPHRRRARSRELKYKVNVNTLEHLAAKTLAAQRDRRLQSRARPARSRSTPTTRTATPAASS